MRRRKIRRVRDMGFEAKGFFNPDHLPYRLGEFGGQRDANGRNSLRTVDYLQYDFLSPENGYRFPGTMLGKQKILAVDGGFDVQGSYRGQSANIAAAIPVLRATKQPRIQFIHYEAASSSQRLRTRTITRSKPAITCTRSSRNRFSNTSRRPS